MRRYRYVFLLHLIVLLATGRVSAQGTEDPRPLFLIRCDDIGMCHDVNTAIERVLASGLRISASVMFACPWYQEAVTILKRYPDASVGVHLTLNSEWKHYRWGPVAGPRAVPSLVDGDGYFFPTRAALFANEPRSDEVEVELRAQIERALASGLSVDYLDYHMGAAVQTAELRSLVEALAQEYGLGIAQYFGEDYANWTYFAQGTAKTDTLVHRIRTLTPGTVNLQVVHVGLDNPEMAALIDVNETGPVNMSEQREGELKALLSKEFRDALLEHNVRLVTYRDIIRERGLGSMVRPQNIR